MQSNVPFEQSWPRLKDEFGKAPGPEAGVHVLSIRKWTQDKGYLPARPFTAVWKGGDVIYCDTEKTDNWRTVPATEFRKVYETWEDYRAERKGRSFTADLGVQNATWVIPLLDHFEHLARPDD